jgi:putative toxin-antitoxin system antitoxin component (TIGR02293 family)
MKAAKKGKGVFVIRALNAEPVNIAVANRFGFFIKEASRAKSFYDLNTIIGKGLPYRSVQPLMTFLDLTTQEIADLTGVSQRTLSRWDDDSIIGVLPSKNLVKVDALVHKGIEVFGSEDSFKSWLQQPNTALGDVKPIDLLPTPYGTELVDDAMEAMEYGNVM